MRKAKRFTAILLAAVLLGGCGQEGVHPESKTEELSTGRTEESTNETKEPEYIDGFEAAEYEKFNSYASENGLGGTLIFIEGKVLNQTRIGDNSEFPTLGLVVEQSDGNRWCASIISDSEVEGITDKNVKIFGTYQGFSDVMNLPGLAVAVEDINIMDKARIEVEENGSWVEAWNFYNDYAKVEIDKLNNTVDVPKTANEGMYLDEQPDTEENILKLVSITSEKTEDGDIVVFITNNNEYSIPDLELQAVFYKDGNIVDTDKDGHDVLVPHNTVVSKMDAPKSYDDYEISATASWKYGSTYRNWIYNINMVSNIGDDNIIVQFKNLGSIDIDELEYIVVFYKENTIIGTSWAKDITDVKSGSTVIENVSTYGVDFDGYEVYINQAHTFFESNGEVIKDTIPENIGKRINVFAESNASIEKENQQEEEIVDKTSEEKQPESTSAVTAGKRNALKSAKNYLSFAAFSYEGLIGQLEYEKYSHDDAVYAADNCGADWNEQALKSAKNYLSFTAFSYAGLIQQLEYEQFTKEQATYGADNCGADWNEQAAKSAENYLSMMSFSKDGLIEQLEYEGFTHEQAVYGAEKNGY